MGKTRHQRNSLLLRDKWHRAVTDSEDSQPTTHVHMRAASYNTESQWDEVTLLL